MKHWLLMLFTCTSMLFGQNIKLPESMKLDSAKCEFYETYFRKIRMPQNDTNTHPFPKHQELNKKNVHLKFGDSIVWKNDKKDNGACDQGYLSRCYYNGFLLFSSMPNSTTQIIGSQVQQLGLSTEWTQEDVTQYFGEPAAKTAEVFYYNLSAYGFEGGGERITDFWIFFKNNKVYAVQIEAYSNFAEMFLYEC